MKILIINGPNLNLLGKRNRDVYGIESFEDFLPKLRKEFPLHDICYFQSNIEGEIIDNLHAADGKYDAVLLNAGGYTHTSVAISDAVEGISLPVVEVHISQVHAREEYRHVSLIAKYVIGSISGFGLSSYNIAMCSVVCNFNLKK